MIILIENQLYVILRQGKNLLGMSVERLFVFHTQSNIDSVKMNSPNIEMG